MKRRKKYKLIKRLRLFRDKAMKIKDESDLINHIHSINEVYSVKVEHGWTTWVTVKMESGESFFESQFWAIDSLKTIANNIYQFLIKPPIK